MKIGDASVLPMDPDAIEDIYEMSRGNMRAIDTLASQSLQTAAGDAKQNIGGAARAPGAI